MLKVKRGILYTLVAVVVLVTAFAVATGSPSPEGAGHCLEEFYYDNSWYCNIGRYNYGTYLCVELDGPWGADFDLYVWRETGRSCDIFGCTIYLRGPDCSSTGFTADESCCFCVWTSGTRWIEVRFIHGSGSFTVRWRWTP
ncbi:TPA: hypothetical protein EYP12_01595, partial [Candidatus Bipolaricaulota bacterium]|nr:hypothetical protein [Candidatus Bipolaricaulota bacterium]